MPLFRKKTTSFKKKLKTGWPRMCKEYDLAMDKYVPETGPADTEFGGVLRNCSNLIYGFYNNGDMLILDDDNMDVNIDFLKECYDVGISEIAAEIEDLMSDPYYSRRCTDEDRENYGGEYEFHNAMYEQNKSEHERQYDVLLNRLADALNLLCKVEMASR